jgi:hypothetical protein
LENDDEQQSVKTGDINGSTVEINQTINIGYTIEQHESALRLRLDQLRTDLERAYNAEKASLELQLQAAQEKLNNLDKSYQEKLAELERVNVELIKLQSKIPVDAFVAAQAALRKGDTKLADQLYANLENDATETAAKAAFERGLIAHADIRWDDALTHFEKARYLKSDNFEYAHVLARQYKMKGDYKKTELIYSEEISRLIKLEDKISRLELASCYNSLGLLYLHHEAIENLDKSFDNLKKANEINKKELGENFPRLATDYNNFGLLFKTYCAVCYSTSELAHSVAEMSQKSETYYFTAIAINDKNQDYVGVAQNFHNLGALYELTNQHNKAEQALNNAIIWQEKLHGESYPNVAMAYCRLAIVYKKQKKHLDAEKTFLKAINIIEGKLSSQYPYVSDIRAEYNKFLIEQGQAEI